MMNMMTMNTSAGTGAVHFVLVEERGEETNICWVTDTAEKAYQQYQRWYDIIIPQRNARIYHGDDKWAKRDREYWTKSDRNSLRIMIFNEGTGHLEDASEGFGIKSDSEE